MYDPQVRTYTEVGVDAVVAVYTDDGEEVGRVVGWEDGNVV